MARLPFTLPPGSYVRYTGPTQDFPTKKQGAGGTNYLRLKTREWPLKYPWTFGAISPGVGNITQVHSFKDLELQPNHVAQVYLGISRGARVRFFQPTDIRLFKWDITNPSEISDQDLGSLEWQDSPIDDPRFSFWLAPTINFVPGVAAENVFSGPQPVRALNVNIIFIASLYEFEFVEPDLEPDIFDKLVKYQIPSTPISFGGGVKAVRA